MDPTATATIDALPFHPSIEAWFASRYAAPTQVQALAWPVIASGEHTLITAPTGSGKTLTAFMWGLSQFASGEYVTGRTQVLYVSPLKALNNDIARNLMDPLASLTAEFNFPQLQVKTRSGDTEQSERQRMLRNPPDILITTPESLALMLTTTKGRSALAHLHAVIIDEIHAIVENRRGAQLMTNLERLADLAGEFQRIALSATVQPLEAVADYVAGRDARGRARDVRIVNARGEKQIEFDVRFPPAARDAADHGQKIWEPLSSSFKEVIAQNAATLFFTNSRRLAEKITLKINQEEPEPLAYAHHGSLARDVRTEVERRLKAGELRAIVATNSLEMGIDIGHLDRVVMVQSPPSVASTLQRIGRAGHSVGEVSYGTLFPTHAHDFLEAAVLAAAVADRDIEPAHLMTAPLDVLAQIILSICATDPWSIDAVYKLVTRASPYEKLARDQFDLVVEMLSGRYAGSRIREMKPRVIHDRINHTIKASRGAILSLYSSGGTIPDRGYFQMRHLDTGSVLGELDEEFVWEATVGQTFTLGTQHWQIHRITHNDVIVRPAKPGTATPPFWRSEFFNRSYHFSQRIGQYLEMTDGQLANREGDELINQLTERAGFDQVAAEELVNYLQRQREHTQTALPHRHNLLVELVTSGPDGYRGPDAPMQIVLHTFWGGQLNQPWALAIRAAWTRKFGIRPDIHADNDAIVIQCQEEPDPHELVSLVTPGNLLELLRESLEQSGFFGARFRECAGRALLLTRQRFNQRLPLWMSRMQAKKLLTQVKRLTDFPVLLETWRTCLDDEFDIPALQGLLSELQDGSLRWTYARVTTPSPFAKNLTFNQVSRYMYADDTPDDDTLSNLSADLIGTAVHNAALRPQLERDVIAEFEAKRQRRAPGYEPRDDVDWAEWVKERILIPSTELPEDFCPGNGLLFLNVDERRWLTHRELVHGLYASGLFPGAPPVGTESVAEPRDGRQLAQEILTFYGPMTETEIRSILPGVPAELLVPSDLLIAGELVEGSTEQFWCDAENLDILLRFQRARRRVEFTARSQAELPAFWASLQSLNRPATEQNQLHALEALRACSAPVETWLHDLLASRQPGLSVQQLDSAMQTLGMVWRGTGKQTICCGYPEDLDLITDNQPVDQHSKRFTDLFTDPNARYTFNQLANNQNLPRETFNDLWWQAVWQGLLAADSVLPLNDASQQKYALAALDRVRTSRRRLPRPSRGWAGNWQLIRSESESDPLTRLENDKERVRLLLDRYGFLNREVTNRENLGPPDQRFRWRDAFRALRLMELGGEVLAGHFFEGLSTPQFITPTALHHLSANTPAPASFWLAAHDPAAPCGLSLDWPSLPARRIGNYLSFAHGELALVANTGGGELTYLLAWDDPGIDAANALFTHLVETRRLHLRINVINGESARLSPYLAGLQRCVTTTSDHKQIILQPGY